MSPAAARILVGTLITALVQTQPARAAKDKVDVRAYVNDSCIIADEPYFVPAAGNKDASAKFLPLLGIIVGKLAELFINHQIEASANRIKSGAARKDTHYAVSRSMNLYRVDFQPAPALKINAQLGCMTVVAAKFKADPAECTSQYAPKELAPETRDLDQSDWKTSRTDDSVENQLRRANVCVEGTPAAVYEARFEFSKDGTAYRLKDAGYRIESLLTTDDRRASRAVVYTLKISNPGATDQQEILSSAWVDIGTVAAGARGTGGKSETAPWLRVPPLSVEARRTFDERTKVHQEVMGEIEALQRAQIRNQRLLTGLDQRIAAAGADLAEGLKQERMRIAVQSQSQSVELEARQAEYQDLPRTPQEFMPVTIEVAVTESESEKKSRLALAEIIGKNSGLVGSALGAAATGLLSRSVSADDIKPEPDAAEGAGDLELARNRYFDALVQTGGSGKASAEEQQNLVMARDKYNAVRRLHGLDPVRR